MRSPLMTPQKNEPPTGTRRTFLRTAGALTAGVAAAPGATAADATLALFGGAPAVSYPAPEHTRASRWPLFGPNDEKVILELLRNPTYGPIGALEKDWKQYYKVPYVKAHCNGTSAIAAMFFALNLPPGSEVLVPSYTFFASIVPMR